MQRSLFLVVFAVLCTGLCQANVSVNVDAGTAVVLGEQDQISANMFGITAFEGFPTVVADRDYRAKVAALRPGCFRFGGSIAWFAPKGYDPAWFATEDAKRNFEQTLLFGSRYPFGRFLPVVRELGAEPMLSLGGPPEYLTLKGTRNPSDFDKWAEYCAAYVGLWREFDPTLRLVQVWNEPNATWFRDPRANDKGTSAADLHIDMANKVARAIKARFPDIRVGGPVLCWPPGWPPSQTGQKPWYTWTGWTLPWLRDTKDTIDFYDFHVYDVSPEDFAVQTEMLYNQAWLTQQRHLPIWVTESSYNLTADEQKDPKAIWSKRLLPYERLLLRGMLPQTDKLAGNLYHDLHARHHTLLPAGAFEPDPMYWLLWILRDLRGTRIVADSSDPSLLTFATVEEDRVTTVLFNDSDQETTVDLSVVMPTGYATGPRTRAIGEAGDGACTRLTVSPELQKQGGRASGQVTLPAHATVSMSFRMQNFARPRRMRVRREYFGDKTVQFIAAGAPVSVNIEVPESAAGRAWLRVGLLGPEPGDQLSAQLDGQAISPASTPLQDISPADDTPAGTHSLKISLKAPTDNAKLALGFASIVVESTKPATP